jgi:hypothetical protein
MVEVAARVPSDLTDCRLQLKLLLFGIPSIADAEGYNKATRMGRCRGLPDCNPLEESWDGPLCTMRVLRGRREFVMMRPTQI